MTVKVNTFTTFINRFSNVGRNANIEIQRLKLESAGDVYQRRLKGGAIALLKKETKSDVAKDIFCIIKSNGAKWIKDTQTFTDFVGKRRWHFMSNRSLVSPWGQNIMTKNKEVSYNFNTGKIEEKAFRKWLADGPVKIMVRSKAVRESKFPSTKLGRGLHASQLDKKVLPNGDILYKEEYPYP